MNRFSAILESLLGASVGDPVVDISRRQVLEVYISIYPEVGRDDAAVLFEQSESAFLGLRSLGRWQVRYNAATVSFHCERIPDPAYLERLCEVGNQAVVQELRRRLETMDGFRFERVVAEILRAAPWVSRILTTQPRKDGGIDLELETKDSGLGSMRALGQAKRWTSKVPVSAIREFIGALQTADPKPHLGFFIATAGYTEDARKAAEKSPLKLQLFDLDHVLQWQVAGKVGLRTADLYLTSIDERFWDEVH